ncbi:voltage-gated potassium channel [Prosthecobacter fusiformis]|uniref:Voltage-gated potassium channel n=1 Tax=Prosthecobacter fusiformis TaxID=48464 RepID=A0A4R7RZM4_9BACT|nr:potassium channel protein - like protein [Prosthecobacter fusiformis]TDU70869.1 voltage-gated potassium channel [Prosthecobacter fusiformis]
MSAPQMAISVPPPTGKLRHGLMLIIALLFLILVGVILPHGDSGESFRENLQLHPWFLPALLGLWALIGIESVGGLFLAPDAWSARMKRLLLISLLPPLRMSTATSTPNGWLWIPGAGWRRTGPATVERMEQKLALPMVILTLLVLPVLGVELGAGEALEQRPQLALTVHLVTCLIWVGFVAEFVWMLSATPQKLAYCLRHWINLVIILLPLVAFLRMLNLFRFARFFRAGKLLRAYRLRTLQSRLWRLALLFNLLERLQQRNPEKYCAGLEKKIGELEAETAQLKEKLETFRSGKLKERASSDIPV